ncbi:serine-rich adhesin for platelets-like [Prorops nasuta]|uniref:serine-rich adhesin for platelets-like n=1 Tax=Prorops nasuta TaxID=863751 RepID=UPI0034CD571E
MFQLFILILRNDLIENSSLDNLSQTTNSFNSNENQEDIALNETCSAHENTGSVASNELHDISTYVVEETVVETEALMTDDPAYIYGIPTPDDSLSSSCLRTGTSEEIVHNNMDTFNIVSSENSQDVSTFVEKIVFQESTNGQDHSLNDSISSLHSGREVDIVTHVSTNESLDSTSQSIGTLKNNPDNSLSSLHSDTEKDTVLDLSTSCSSISTSQSKSIVTDFNSEKTLTTEETKSLSKTWNQNEEVKVVTTNGDLNISPEILKFAKIPQIKPKKRKIERSEVTVNTVGEVIQTLQKKENEKILRQTQIELKKTERREESIERQRKDRS